MIIQEEGQYMDDKTIFLGKFRVQEDYYNSITLFHRNFPFRKLLSPDEIEIAVTYLEIVDIALKRCGKCVFLLDYLQFPISNDNSHTSEELRLLLSNEDHFQKTIFYLDKKEITQEKAKQLIYETNSHT